MRHSDIPLRVESPRSQVLGSLLKDACTGPMLLVPGILQPAYPVAVETPGVPFQMSIAPPGYPTDETDPSSGNRQADDTEQHEFKSVQALRGRENSAKASGRTRAGSSSPRIEGRCGQS